MEIAAIIGIIQAARQVTEFALEQAAILRAQGGITVEQMEAIRQRAAITDARFDELVAQAKARRAAGGGGS